MKINEAIALLKNHLKKHGNLEIALHGSRGDEACILNKDQFSIDKLGPFGGKCNQHLGIVFIDRYDEFYATLGDLDNETPS